MSMHKIFFGTIVFFSLAFLSACGGGGGSGSSGAAGSAGSAGADGAAGATGSIALFQDVNLNISYNGNAGAVPGSTPAAHTALDSDAVLGTISGSLIVSGTDNLTADSRAAYYLYTETSAGVKRALEGEAHTRLSVQDVSLTNNLIDSRVKSTDNTTVTITDYALLEGLDATAYFSVCPGNEAGDGACAKVIAPVDRGIAMTPASASQMNVRTPNNTDLGASITYAGSSFHVLSDNGSGGGVIVSPAAIGYRISPTKAGWATALSSDNTSTFINTEPYDNDSRVGNLLARGTDLWVAMSADNSSVTGVADSEGDNVSLAVRANGTPNFTDNGSVVTNHASLTTPPQIASSGDGVYVFLGSGATVTAYNVRDNGSTTALTGLTSVDVDTWCSTSTGTAGPTNGGTGYAVIVHGTNATAVAHSVDQIYDNGTTTRKTTAAEFGNTNATSCAITHLAGTFYLAMGDSADNVSVWKSDNLTGWAQIGTDFSTDGTIADVAIATTGTSASDNGVWVAVNDANNVEVLHYEDIAGGSTYAWRSVGAVIAGASTTIGGNGRISIATDGTSVIAVTAIDTANTQVGIWFNQ